MQEPSWAEGYVVDVDYTHGYFSELAPSALHFVTMLGAVETPDLTKPYVYYELGCGNGHSTVVHAAANPNGHFLGVDFNPTHIQHARKLAQERGVGNVQFLEKSFAELLEADLPEADMVTMHGVYSWVSEENRGLIVEFLRRRLKPGGLFHLSYNCMPGLVQMGPVQRLLMQQASLAGGTLPDRIGTAMDFVRKLEQAGARYFFLNPLAKDRLERLAKENANYLAHEYFNSNWTPFYHADVASDLGAAKLSYVGSAVIMDNFEEFILTPDMSQLLSGIGDRTQRETLKDYARNQSFRRDVFARGVAKVQGPELEAWLGRSRFTLRWPRAKCKLKANTPVGEAVLQASTCTPVLDALARRPMTFDELSREVVAIGMNRIQLRQIVFSLAALNNLTLALPAEGEEARRSATNRYNQAVLSRATAYPNGTVLTSPVLGGGVSLRLVDLLLLRNPVDDGGATNRVLAEIKQAGLAPSLDPAVPNAAEMYRGRIEQQVREFFEITLPFIRVVGVDLAQGV